MKKNYVSFFYFLMFLFCTSSIFAQDSKFANKGKAEVPLFNYSSDKVPADMKTDDPSLSFFRINREALDEINLMQFREVILDFPASRNKNSSKIQLAKKNIFSRNMKVKLSSDPDEEFQHSMGVFYQGKVVGESNSLAVFSVFEDNVFGWVVTSDGYYSIGQSHLNNDVYVCNFNQEIPELDFPFCHTIDDQKSYSFGQVNFQTKSMSNCVKVFVEVDNNVVTQEGSVAAAINFVNHAFNQSNAIYAAEMITMIVSDMFVWDTPSPYSGNPSSRLNQFQQERTDINGADIGHLVAWVNNGGVAAGFDAICNPEVRNRLCYSGMTAALNDYPEYSFIPFILAHEMGHLLGSRHTHACVWNGNNTAIDGCSGFTEGTCPNPGLPPDGAGGTIMSYCHNASSSIDFNLGFGPQPGNVIRSFVHNADCLTTDCGDCDIQIVDIDVSPSFGCSTFANGSITVTATSSYGPFEYALSGPVFQSNTTGVFNNLPNGVYIISVYDLGTNGCTTIEYVTVGNSADTLPANIPSFNSVTSSYTHTGSYPIEEINLIGLKILHNRPDLLAATLTSPQGTTIQLFQNPICEWRNIFVSFKDDAPNTAADLNAACGFKSYAIQGDFQPIDPFSDFHGENPEGTWTLTIISNTSVTGTLVEWGLEICPGCDASITLSCNNLNVDFNGEEEIMISFDEVGSVSSECELINISLSRDIIYCNEIGTTVPIQVSATNIANIIQTCTSIVSVTGLPCGWSATPEGINCPDGNSVGYNTVTEQFTLEASNCFYSQPFNAQSTSFVSHDLCGDGMITAEVQNINGLAWAGITIREDDSAGSKMVSLSTNLSNFLRREARTVTNGNAFPQQFLGLNRYWLRLVRQGNTVIGLSSSNGTNWFQVLAVPISLPNCIICGFFSTNYNSNSHTTAVFGNVSVDELWALNPGVLNDNFIGVSGNHEAFQLYPNPAGDLVYLVIEDARDDVFVKITDSMGRQVDNHIFNTNGKLTQELDVSKLSNGIYFIKVFSEQMGEQIKRIAIQK